MLDYNEAYPNWEIKDGPGDIGERDQLLGGTLGLFSDFILLPLVRIGQAGREERNASCLALFSLNSASSFNKPLCSQVPFRKVDFPYPTYFVSHLYIHTLWLYRDFFFFFFKGGR